MVPSVGRLCETLQMAAMTEAQYEWIERQIDRQVNSIIRSTTVFPSGA